MITSSTSQRLSASILTATSAAKENKSSHNLPLSGGGTGIPTDPSAVVALGTATSLADVAKKYDVQNMSPREMAAMSQELYQAGALSFQDHALLSFQPELGPQYQNLSGQPGNPDAPRDFIAQWNEQLQIHEKNGEMSFVKNDYRILNILGNLASLHKASASD